MSTHTERQRDRETERQRDRETERQTERGMVRERERRNLFYLLGEKKNENSIA